MRVTVSYDKLMNEKQEPERFMHNIKRKESREMRSGKRMMITQ